MQALFITNQHIHTPNTPSHGANELSVPRLFTALVGW